MTCDGLASQVHVTSQEKVLKIIASHVIGGVEILLAASCYRNRAG